MSNGEIIPLSERAAALRQIFDQAFAQAPGGAAAATEAFLAVGIGGDNYALRLSEVTELYVDKTVVPLPSHSPDLLGIASFRGALIPIYDLRLLLGYTAAAWPRWLVLVGSDMPIGLAFDHLDGYLNLPSEAIAPAAESTRRYLAESLSAAGTVRPVIDVASIVTAIREQVVLRSSSEPD